MPGSSGCTSLVRPLGMILPGATETMSTVPNAAQAAARQVTTMTVMVMARPIGDGGVSTISSAAGRKSSSARERLALVDDMDSCLQFVESCVPAGRAHEFVVRAVLDKASLVDGEHAIGDAQGREAVGDDHDCPAMGDLAHVSWTMR